MQTANSLAKAVLAKAKHNETHSFCTNLELTTFLPACISALAYLGFFVLPVFFFFSPFYLTTARRIACINARQRHVDSVEDVRAKVKSGKFALHAATGWAHVERFTNCIAHNIPNGFIIFASVNNSYANNNN